jgi:hypothetical protein
MQFKWSIKAVIATLAIILVGCASQPTPPTQQAAQQLPTLSPTLAPTPTRTFVSQTIARDPREQVRLRFVNAAPNYDALDVYADQITIASQLRFGASTAGSQIVAGNYTFTAFVAGSSPDTEPLLSAPLELQGGSSYTMLLSTQDNQLRLDAIPDDLSALPSGQSRLLVLHAAPMLATVDIGLPGEQPLVSDLAFTQSSPAFSLPTGRTTLQARPEGQEAIETIINLRDGYGYTLILQGERPQWVEFEDRIPGQATAHFVNALSANLGAVNVYLDGRQVAADLVFGAASDVTTIAATTSTLRVLATGATTDDQALIDTAVTSNNGDFVAFVLVGDAETARVITMADSRQTLQSDLAAVTFLNVYPNAPQLRNNGEGVIQQDIELLYADNPLSIEFSQGDESFYWRPGLNSANEREYFDPRTFMGGSSYLYILTGREDAPALVFERQLPAPEVRTAVDETIAVRWVNAIEGASLVFALDAIPQVDNLAFATTETSQINPGSYILTVATGAGRSQDIVLDLASFQPLSIYAYGSVDDPQVIIVDEQTAPGINLDIARLRMTYLAPLSTNRSFSLAYATAPQATANNAFAPTYAEESSNLPFGADMFLQRATAGTTTLAGQLPTGTYDLYLVDDLQDSVIAVIPAAPLAGDTFYELIVVQSVFSDDISLIVLQVQASA